MLLSLLAGAGLPLFSLETHDWGGGTLCECRHPKGKARTSPVARYRSRYGGDVQVGWPGFLHKPFQTGQEEARLVRQDKLACS